MTLELARFAQSLTRIGDATVSQQRRNAELATLARRTMERAPSVEEIAAVVKNSRRGESLAVPLEPPATTHQPPDALAPYTVLGVDGSHHELDRYSAAACAVVNLGGWRIRYGDFPEAEQLYDMRVLTGESAVLDDGSVIDAEAAADAPGSVPAYAITGLLLGAYRGAWESLFMAEGVRAALANESNLPLVGLLDGVLLPWTIPGTNEAARHQAARLYVRALSDLRATIDGRRAALGSYVSHPRAAEVMNTLALLAGEPDLVGHADTLVFAPRLAPGERSASFETFASAESWPQKEHFGPARHGTGFFYVNIAPSADVPGEVARVEFPAWLWQREGALDLLHAAVLDQCRRARGYPLVLQEAHERAVLDQSDRRAMQTLVEGELSRRGIQGAFVGKHISKRARRL